MAPLANCQGQLRRDCLKLGLGSLLGGGLASALDRRAYAGQASRHTSCILIWLDGGPSHFETFDPKPEAAVEYRGEFSAIATKTHGYKFSENMVKLASISDKLSIVRSIRHDQNNHGAGNHYMMTGAPTRIPVGCGAFVSFHPSMGSVVSSQRGAPPGVPPYFSLPSQTRSGGPNFLGAKHAPFEVADDPNSKSFRVRDVSLPSGLEEGRILERRQLRQQLDSLLRFRDTAAIDPVLSADQSYQQALELMTSQAALEAFDINREPDHVRNAYGRTRLGQQALLARRLTEAGVPFVTINNGGWDHHSEIFERFKTQGRELDLVVAALIDDLEARGQLQSTLVIVMGEFGRTPAITRLPDRKTVGRDHWSSAISVLVAGCGTPGGQIIGATDKNGFTAVEKIYGPENLVSSVYLKLGIDPSQFLTSTEGRPVQLVSNPKPIKELMG
jgi:hypothetical protein